MAEKHFWQIDIFLLKDFLVRLIIWLDAPYKNLEIQSLIIFLSCSYELWRAFTKGHLGIFYQQFHTWTIFDLLLGLV